MNLFESLVYGFISGFSGFLPISFRAHQDLLLVLFGTEDHDPVRNLLVLIAMLFALFHGCRTVIDQIRRENSARIHNRSYKNKSAIQYDTQLLKNAVIPLLLGVLVLSYLTKNGLNLVWTALFLLINGIILFIPDRIIRANRGASFMSFFDSVLLGLSCALSAISGFSGIGCSTSVAISRGAEPKKALNWALLLTIPALFLLAVIDFIAIFSYIGSHGIWGNLFGYVLSAIGAYIGGYLSILFMKFLAQRNGFSNFSYYCWGAALLTFILYLIVV